MQQKFPAGLRSWEWVEETKRGWEIGGRGGGRSSLFRIPVGKARRYA